MMKCVRSTYELFQAGESYPLIEKGQVGRFTVYEYTDAQGWVYTFGLDENGENETDGNFMKFTKE